MFKVRRKKTGERAKSPPPPIPEPSPEVIKAVEEEFPEEDTASKREHFERLINAAPASVFDMFATYVWRQNVGVSDVEIVKDGSKPGELEPGMIRRLVGYEEELITVKKPKLIEYRVLEGMPTSYHKSRILFKPENDGSATRVVWTIWWTPTSTVAALAYTMMMKGFCNLALYRLENAVLFGKMESGEPDNDNLESTDDDATTSDGSSLEVSALKDGETPTLQWAARMQTGYEGNLTAEQQKGLSDLREMLRTTDPEVYELCQKHPDGPDRIMLRFLRAECSGKARKFNIEKSKKRLAETLKFRRDIKADELITKKPPKFDDFVKVGGELVIEDREGRVVVFTRAGLLSTCLDTKIMTEEEWKTNLVAVTERRMQMLRENSKKLGHEISATVVVYDVRGLGLASRRILPFTRMINDVASKHYPELVDMIVVTFAPGLFTTIFASIKGFLDPVTASKIRVFGTGKNEVAKMKATLRSIADPKVLPREFGGDSEVEVGYPWGYKGEKYAYD